MTPRFIAAGLLRAGYGDKEKLTGALIDAWYETWRRECDRLAMLARLRQYVSGDVEGKIRPVREPVLQLWGGKNTAPTLAAGV